MTVSCSSATSAALQCCWHWWWRRCRRHAMRLRCNSITNSHITGTTTAKSSPKWIHSTWTTKMTTKVKTMSTLLSRWLVPTSLPTARRAFSARSCVRETSKSLRTRFSTSWACAPHQIWPDVIRRGYHRSITSWTSTVCKATLHKKDSSQAPFTTKRRTTFTPALKKSSHSDNPVSFIPIWYYVLGAGRGQGGGPARGGGLAKTWSHSNFYHISPQVAIMIMLTINNYIMMNKFMCSNMKPSSCHLTFNFVLIVETFWFD